MTTATSTTARKPMLPLSLLLLLLPALTFAQTRQELSLNSVAFFNTIPNPPSFVIPGQGVPLTITVALCSGSSSQPMPRFIVTNSTNNAIEDDPTSTTGGPDVFEIGLDDGLGTWTGEFPSGGVLAVEENGAQMTFEIGVSNDGPIHEHITSLPLLGDTTSNQALIFSHPFESFDRPKPSYPNYTLPVANQTLPSPTGNTPNFTLILSPTSNNLAARHQTGCFLSSQPKEGNITSETIWLKDQQGWRDQWLMGGLTPATNYTAYVLQDTNKVSGPIFFATKSASFSCPLVHSLPYCPGISYPIPLPAPPSAAPSYTTLNLPQNITDPLLSYLTNFTTTLTTFACGRDWYSPLVGCDDCQIAYRTWLCSITFTRCSEPSPSNPNAFTTGTVEPTATGLSALGPSKKHPDQKVFSALVPQDTARPEARRSPTLPPPSYAYDMLLPCIETCTAMDRACPAFLGIKCPTAQFNAAASYGVGYVDSADGDQGGGVTGNAADQWGNVWCNPG
ncbi:stretch-activated cation channel Mid1 [Crucibulum laeve]|uniref:Stretch-activated cation channel Mid1 n=1 Tax=Crucibulum laeve TaxID=68775 RepID=A0A5C3LTD8_9AGAR|nr:stretch-activated cation channel Mid1 [Crucibulum laeve]